MGLSDAERERLMEAARAAPTVHGDVLRGDVVDEVYHLSEDATLARFAPHVPATNPSHPAAVWALDAAHVPLYWFPRACPRVSVWAYTPEQRALLRERFQTEAVRLCAAESDWMRAVRDVRLYQYAFDAADFEPWPQGDGQYVAYHVVRPRRVDCIDDVLARHAAAEVELRFTPRLGELADQILVSGLPFSFVRIRDARR